MHAFLVFCVLAEAGFIGLLLWNARRHAIGADAVNQRLDEIVARLALIPEGVTETNWSEIAAALYRHTDEIEAIKIESDRVGSYDMARFSDQTAAHADLVRQVGILNATGDAVTSNIRERLTEAEGKISDLSEGCAKLDADLSEVSEDVRECVKLRQSDLAGLNERITEIADAQEKARRKSGIRNSPPGAFESLRAVAESNAVKHPDPAHAELVSLARGPD